MFGCISINLHPNTIYGIYIAGNSIRLWRGRRRPGYVNPDAEGSVLFKRLSARIRLRTRPLYGLFILCVMWFLRLRDKLPGGNLVLCGRRKGSRRLNNFRDAARFNCRMCNVVICIHGAIKIDIAKIRVVLKFGRGLKYTTTDKISKVPTDPASDEKVIRAQRSKLLFFRVSLKNGKCFIKID